MIKKENRNYNLNIRISNTQIEKIKKIALDKDTSISQLIRDLINELIYEQFNF